MKIHRNTSCNSEFRIDPHSTLDPTAKRTGRVQVEAGLCCCCLAGSPGVAVELLSVGTYVLLLWFFSGPPHLVNLVLFRSIDSDFDFDSDGPSTDRSPCTFDTAMLSR